jgi:serine/threonine protein kinase
MRNHAGAGSFRGCGTACIRIGRAFVEGIAAGVTLDGRYQLTQLIGAGATGEVYEATGPGSKSFAVKVLPPPTSAQDSARFAREVSAAARLESHHVVPVLDHGIDPVTGSAFLVMPRIRARSLQDLIERTGPLHPQAVVRIGIQIARGLEDAHAKGVVHRDVKPSNVLLEIQPDGSVVARLCDFGVAKLADAIDRLTATGSVLGTPLYMAPEQARDTARVDTRSDLWSLGATLYHALSGTTPLAEAKTYHQWLDLLCNADRPWLQDVAPWIEGPMARAVHGALVRDPEFRCPSAHAFVAALTKALRGNQLLREAVLTRVPDELRADPATRADPPATWQEIVVFADQAPVADSLLGKILDGRYELTRRVGQGGMGAVYEAKTKDGAVFAIKVIRPELLSNATDRVRRFLREARAVMAVESDNVVRVVEAASDKETGLPFIVMEMLRGTDLAKVIQAHGPIEPSVAAWVFWKVCQGLGTAHALGMVHRDIKPANIFLHESEHGALVPKLCDFGVAKTDASLREHSATALTQTGGILGSPLYMSPEQAENAKNADPRSDVWSLAISLYEALTGRLPWCESTTIGELMLCLYTKDVPPIQDFAPWVDPGLAAVVHRGLLRDASLRYAAAAEMAEALEPFASQLHDPGVDVVRPVSEAMRSVVPSKLDGIPRSDSKDVLARGARSVSGVTSVSASPASGRRWGPRTVAGGSVVALGVVALAAFVAFRTTGSPSPDDRRLDSPSAASIAAPAASSLPRIVAKVAIRPESAAVAVDDVPAPVQSGFITIERRPGESAVVVVEHRGIRQSATVIVTSDGRAVPNAVEVNGASTSAAPPGLGPNARAPIARNQAAPSAPAAPAEAPKPKALNSLQEAVVERPPF